MGVVTISYLLLRVVAMAFGNFNYFWGIFMYIHATHTCTLTAHIMNFVITDYDDDYY